MALRNVHVFPQRTQRPAVFNRTYVVQQQQAPKANNSAFWGAGLAGLLIGTLNGLAENPELFKGARNEYDLLNQMQQKEPLEQTVKNNPEIEPETKTNPEPETDPAKVDENKDDGLGGQEPLPEYSIKEDAKTTETVKTIKYGGPWHYAQYYTDENGKQLQIGSAEFSAIMNSLKTEMGEVDGDRSLRVLPKEITIGGKTYSLMGAAERDALGLIGEKGTTDTRYRAISNGSTYSVFETKDGNTTLIGSDLTKEQAETLKASKEAEAAALAASNDE